MRPDWIHHDLPFYHTVLLDAVLRSRLYDQLRRGCTVGQLVHRGYSRTYLRPVLEALQDGGYVRYDRPYWHWVGQPPTSGCLEGVAQAARWLHLSRTLMPSNEDPGSWEARGEQARLLETGQYLTRWLLKTLPVKADDVWLDVGAGPGQWAREIAPRVHRVVAVDRAQAFQDWPAGTGVILWRGDVLDTLPPGPFTKISLIRFVEVLPRAQLVGLLRRLGSRLADSGELYIVGYFKGSAPLTGLFQLELALKNEGHVYSVPTLKRLARLAGWVPSRFDHDAESGYGVLGFRRLSLPPPQKGGHPAYGPYDNHHPEKIFRTRPVSRQ